MQFILPYFRNGQLSLAQITSQSQNVSEWTYGIQLPVLMLRERNERNSDIESKARITEWM